MNNKEYKAVVGSACAKTANGGFMIYDSCRLYFKKDSVKIHLYQVSTDTPSILRKSVWKSYLYRFNTDTVTIKGFDYEKLLYKGDTLVYFFKLDNGSLLSVNFVKE